MNELTIARSLPKGLTNWATVPIAIRKQMLLDLGSSHSSIFSNAAEVAAITRR